MGRGENGDRGRARAHGATCYAPRGSHQPVRHIHGAGIVLVSFDEVRGRSCWVMPADTRLVAAVQVSAAPTGEARSVPASTRQTRRDRSIGDGNIPRHGRVAARSALFFVSADAHQSVSSKAWRMGERAPSALSRMPLGFAAPALTASRMPGRVASSLSSQRCPRLCFCAGAPCSPRLNRLAASALHPPSLYVTLHDSSAEDRQRS